MTAHMSAMFVLLNNHDNLNNQPFGYGAGVTSGRWMLQLLGDLAHALKLDFNLPFFNAAALIFLLACSAALLVTVLNIRSSLSAALMGGMMTVFPAVASTLMYRFASVYYGIAILLSLLAPWFWAKGFKYIPLAALCIGCSLGIYQAYVPVTISVFVLMLLQLALEGRTRFRELTVKGFSAALCLVLGLGVYYLCMKLTLWSFGVTLTDYQGIDQMGSISLSALPGLVVQALKGCLLPLRDYCGLAFYPLIRLVYGLLYLLGGFALLRNLGNCRDLLTAAFAGLMALLLPVAVNFIVIMCPDGYVYTLMVYSFFLLACVPAVLLEALPREDPVLPPLQKAASLLMALLITGYLYQTGINYTAVYFANRQTENYVASLVTQVRMTEDFDTEKKWAFLGEIRDPLLSCQWEKHVSIGGIAYTKTLLSSYSLPGWLQNYCGYTVPMADQAAIAALWDTAEVQAMPCWPDSGSIRVIGDTVVIKCQEHN